MASLGIKQAFELRVKKACQKYITTPLTQHKRRSFFKESGCGVHTVEVNGGQWSFFTNILQNILFCVYNKKESRMGIV